MHKTAGLVGLLTILAIAMPGLAQDKPILAVMEIQDKTAKFKRKDLEAATEYLSTLLIASGKYSVVEKGRQEAKKKQVVKDLKRETYDACYDDKCRIELGRALAADTLLACSILSMGKTCTLTCRMVPLEKEVADRAAVGRFACDIEALGVAVDTVAQQLGADQKGSKLDAESAPQAFDEADTTYADAVRDIRQEQESTFAQQRLDKLIESDAFPDCSLENEKGWIFATAADVLFLGLGIGTGMGLSGESEGFPTGVVIMNAALLSIVGLTHYRVTERKAPAEPGGKFSRLRLGKFLGRFGTSVSIVAAASGGSYLLYREVDNETPRLWALAGVAATSVVGLSLSNWLFSRSQKRACYRMLLGQEACIEEEHRMNAPEVTFIALPLGADGVGMAFSVLF
jgi:hypothetical protein